MLEWRTDASAMTFDMVSMERSKGFVKALQELKNLRPQFYSAAEYCEKSYLHNEQKQIVLENLKDYAVRALVNAVDHLGTVAYKLNDLFDQQASDLGTVEIKISSLNQRVLSSQCFIDEDNLRERQLFAVCPRLQKRYILPNSASKAPANDTLSPIRSIPIPSPKSLDSASKAPANGNPSSLSESNQSTIQSRTHPNSLNSQRKAPANGNQSPIESTPGPHPPRTPGTKTLLWHLASETNGVSNGASKPPRGNDDAKKSKNSDLPHQTAHKVGSGTPPSDQLMRSLLVKDAAVANELSSVRSTDNTEIIRAPIRSKSMLSAFFVKNKYPKQKKALVL